ncbi:MAG TPA: hypothetical protein VIZ43_24825, partial [Trebonia sp.]
MRWMADVVAGQNWPEADEDGLRDAAEGWDRVAADLWGLGDDIGGVTRQVDLGYSGAGSGSFHQFMGQLASAPGQLAPALAQVGNVTAQAALDTETAKLMILAQVAWTAGELLWMLESPLTWPEIPGLIAASRYVIGRVALRLLESAARSAVQMTVMDLGVQGVEVALGDRKGIDWREVLSSMQVGAFAGAVAGAFHLGAEKLAPKFVSSLAGKVTMGAVDGAVTGEAVNLAFAGGQSPGLAVLSGLVGAAGAAGKERIRGYKAGRGGPGVPGIRLPGAPRLAGPELEPLLAPGTSDDESGTSDDGPGTSDAGSL